MDVYTKIANVKKFTDFIGNIYGTEDFSIYLYSLIKMRKPSTVVELGTGLGSIMLWAGLALEENGSGKFYTVDNGSEWNTLRKSISNISLPESHHIHISNLLSHFELQNQVTFINSNINNSILPDNIDILFSDFSHGPKDIVRLFIDYFLKMNDNSIIMIDSASTYFSSFLMLNQLIDILNKGGLPKSILDSCSRPDQMLEKVKRCNFSIQHIIENKDRAQNSTACIYIAPIDIIPNSVNMRF